MGLRKIPRGSEVTCDKCGGYVQVMHPGDPVPLAQLMGWKEIKGRYFCYKCAPAVLHEESEKEQDITEAKHTPGPWKWYGYKNQIHLATCIPGGGRLTVMDFVRMGMQEAQPRFAVRSDTDRGGLMHKAQDLAIKKDYGDQEWIDMPHPDARLIAAAPVMHNALTWLHGWIDGLHDRNQIDLDSRERALFIIENSIPKKAEGDNYAMPKV